MAFLEILRPRELIGLFRNSGWKKISFTLSLWLVLFNITVISSFRCSLEVTWEEVLSLLIAIWDMTTGLSWLTWKVQALFSSLLLLMSYDLHIGCQKSFFRKHVSSPWHFCRLNALVEGSILDISERKIDNLICRDVRILHNFYCCRKLPNKKYLNSDFL